MQLNHIIPLLDKLARREHSPAEMDVIRHFLQHASRQDAEAAMEHYYTALEGINISSDTKALAYRLEQLISSKPLASVHRIHFLKTAWFKYAAAILLVLTGAITYYFFHTSQSQVEVAQTTPSPLPEKDILPGSKKAILTLSNGQQVQLNNATSETINDGTLSIKNINGQLSYTSGGSISPAGGGGREAAGGGSRSARTATNTMSTPNGGQYQLTLSDGTKVWLNAASSITYPIAFTAKTREVSITGEAYFEVAKNASKPFVVKTPEEDITVLGTSFNVNAYPEESSAKTSLLEGVVRINNVLLKPGQAYTSGKVITTNIDQDIAWKNGLFHFESANLKTILRQFERWYDIEVIYEGPVSDEKFFSIMSRNAALSTVLKSLQANDVRFRVEGKKLYIQ